MDSPVFDDSGEWMPTRQALIFLGIRESVYHREISPRLPPEAKRKVNGRLVYIHGPTVVQFVKEAHAEKRLKSSANAEKRAPKRERKSSNPEVDDIERRAKLADVAIKEAKSRKLLRDEMLERRELVHVDELYPMIQQSADPLRRAGELMKRKFPEAQKILNSALRELVEFWRDQRERIERGEDD